MIILDKKIIFSGIKPSGDLNIGHFLGALRNWVQLQEEYSCVYSVVDMHAITERQDPQLLRERTLSTIAQYIAAGIDPERTLIFIQSHIHTHAELAWVLNCYTMFGELSRMTQFKDKSKKNSQNINAGLFDYPVLMAADILLYNASLVPVGKDQKQHLELARDIALRFNGLYGDVFTVPEGYFPKVGAKIMSLQNPSEKMSKSDDNANACVALLDAPEVIIKKFKRAVTDSDTQVRYGEGKEGINNLMTIYSSITGKSFKKIESEFSGRGYGDFKAAVGECVAQVLRPVRERYKDIMNNRDYLEKVYTESAKKALYISGITLDKVYKKLGFVKRGF